MPEGYVDEKTAQLILDVLTWDHQTWMNGYDFEGDIDPQVIKSAKEDFIRFCRFYGIKGVARVNAC